MKISRIKLTNFRSHVNFSEKFSPQTIIIGPNGVGKTNIIEAILLASTTRSHRTNHDRDLIAWESEFARNEIHLEENDQKSIIATFITNTPTFSKSYMLNNSPKKASEIVGFFQSVLFSPESLDLVYSSPSLRRRFLDIILCQSDRHYLRQLSQYNHVIRERNKLLFYLNRGNSHVDELQFWDDKVITLGSDIINKRANLCQSLDQSIKKAYPLVSGTKDKSEIIYKNNVNPEQFEKTILENRQREIKYTSTLFGPHRDDLLFFLNDHPLSTSGSRGECRSFILALKLAEIDYLTKIHNQPPVLLLDDVFSELDHDRRSRLADIIENQQTIITATDLDNIDKKTIKTATIIKLTPNP